MPKFRLVWVGRSCPTSLQRLMLKSVLAAEAALVLAAVAARLKTCPDTSPKTKVKGCRTGVSDPHEQG